MARDQDATLRQDALSQPAGSAPQSPTRRRYVVLAVGCALAFLVYFHRQAFVGGQTKIQTDLNLDDKQMSYFSAAFLLGYALFQIPCGVIGDRLGARNLLTILMAGWSILTAATAFADWLPKETAAPLIF